MNKNKWKKKNYVNSDKKKKVMVQLDDLACSQLYQHATWKKLQ